MSKNMKHDFVSVLCPKTIKFDMHIKFPNAYIVTIEEFTNRDVFLNLFSMITKQTLVIMENVSRYTVLSSTKFNYLHRIRMKTKNRFLIDIVPFTKNIVKLYLPYSYLDREILRYSNGHAFEYEYGEIDENGNIINSHDFDFLCKKITNHSHICYDQFLPKRFNIISSHLTENEKVKYANRKKELFSIYNNAHKIVTEICDFANMVDSRKDKLIEILRQLHGNSIIYTNIVKNNPPIRRKIKSYEKDIKTDISITTYYTHKNTPIKADNIILFETPINNRFFMLDVLSDI